MLTVCIRSQRGLLGALWLAAAACGAPAEAASTVRYAAPAELAVSALPPPTSPLGRVLGSGVLRACARSDAPPFGVSFAVSGAGGLDSFEIALASEIASQIGIDDKQPLEIEWIVVSPHERTKHLQNGACDIAVAAVERAEPSARHAQIATSTIYIAERSESYVVGVRDGSSDLEAAVNHALDGLARSGRIALLAAPRVSLSHSRSRARARGELRQVQLAVEDERSRARHEDVGHARQDGDLERAAR